MIERILLAAVAFGAALAVLNRDRWLARMGTQKNLMTAVLGFAAAIAFGTSTWLSFDDHLSRTKYRNLLREARTELDKRDLLAREQQLQDTLRAALTMPAGDSARDLNGTRVLGFRLLKRLVTDSSTQNLAISPVGVEMCLAIAANGAAGKTQAEIAGLLGTSVTALDAVNEANAAMLVTLAGSSGPAELTIANSIWGRKELVFARPFLDVCSRNYSASARTLDFASPIAIQEINGWVARKTHGLIRTIIGSIKAEDVALMLSAVHFRCRWAMPFDPRRTSASPFHLADGSRVERQMMWRNGNFGYLATDSFSAVALPFVHDRFWLYVFVPSAANGLPGFVKRLGDDNWQTWMSGFRTELVYLGLPRFRLEYEANLKASLTALGMTTAFDSARADFTPMVAKSPLQPVWLSDALHKVFIEVNEEGAQAAAASGFGIAGIPDEVVVDRPFFFAITDTWSGAILFMGVVYDPPQ